MDKKDIEAGLNGLLGLDVRWSDLRMEDLEELQVYFSDDKRLCDTLGKEILKERVGSRVDSVFDKLRLAKVGSGNKGGMLKEMFGGR